MRIQVNFLVILGFLTVFISGCNTRAPVDPDRFTVKDPNLVLELVAASTDIQTPIGMAIDDKDDLYVLESHTHSPPEDYQGPGFDRIKKGVDLDADGIPDKWLIYADSLEDGMNLVFGPEQELYVTTKDAVWAFHDRNGDGLSDQRQLLLDMVMPESPYDHAAILGIAVSPDHQWLFVSRGNTGAAFWEIVGTDGSSISGYGDGGNVMRCRLDGSQLEEIATGFWNPFDLKFTTDGRLMLTDNDPDSRGPNRLIEIVPGGDYGYKSLYGGSGLHPFVAWNAELPGTLPYAAPLGEAPCSLLDAGFTGFGAGYKNTILVNVWEEKNIVKIPLKASGTSVQGVPEVLIQGDSTFHPVALAANSRGDVYVTNWVVRQYPNHGKGEIWKISSRQGSSTPVDINPDHYRFKNGTKDRQQLMEELISGDPFLQTISRRELQRSAGFRELTSLLNSENSEIRLQGLMTLCRRSEKLSAAELVPLLKDQDHRVRKMALYYIGTRQVQGMEEVLQASLQEGRITPDLFELFLASFQNLNPEFVRGYQQKTEKNSSRLNRSLPDNFIKDIIANPGIAEPVRALALPYLEPVEEHLDLLLDLLKRTGNPALQLALINGINSISIISDNHKVNEILLKLVINHENLPAVRANAMAAIRGIQTDDCSRLGEVLTTADSVLRYAVVKQLCSCADDNIRASISSWITDNRGSLSNATKAAWENCQSQGVVENILENWADAVDGNGSVMRGELVFKSPTSLCQTCHRVNGWGGEYGPDLSGVGSSKSQAQLINAILDPSQEMAPEWQGWYVTDRDGHTHLGRQIDVHLDHVELMNISGEFDRYANPRSYGVADNSVMPEGLQNTMTRYEFNDLIAYLMSLNSNNIQ